MILFVKDRMIINADSVQHLTLDEREEEFMWGLMRFTRYNINITYQKNHNNEHLFLTYTSKRVAKETFNDVLEQIRFHARDDAHLTKALEDAIGDNVQ